MIQGFLFGDVVYLAREHAASDGFFIGQLVAHGNVRLSERLSFFSEASATARQDAYAFEIERAILRYDIADQLKLSVGRYHTPISYWNTAFHHGLWLQTSVARPEIIRVGGVFLPVHFVGAVAEGTLGADAVAFSYEAGIGNGRGVNIARAGDAGDVNRNRALSFAARLRPGDVGLQLGGALYLDKIGVNSPRFDERIATAHLVWDRGAPEVMLEYAAVRHEADGTPTATYDSHGWYAHFGYRLPGKLSPVKPYVRGERVDKDEADPVFALTVPDYRALIAGLRFDFEDLAALKAEYRREKFGGADAVNSLFLQVAFAIPLSGGM